MARLTQKEIVALKAVRERLTFEKAHFDNIGPTDDTPLPKKESEVNEFIRNRTRIFRQSWVFPILDELIARAEGREVPLGDRVIDETRGA